MIEKLMKFKHTPNIIILLIIMLLVWLIAPYISLGGSHPFITTGSRCLILSLLGLAWGIKWVIEKIQQHQSQIIPIAKTKLEQYAQKTKQYSQTFKQDSHNYWQHLKNHVQHQHEKRQMNKLPWYLVMGPAQSGKKTMLSNCSLHAVQAQHLGREAVNATRLFPNYQWWFTHHGVFVQTDYPDAEQEQLYYKKWIKYLKKRRKRKPLSGLLLTISLTDLLLSSQDQRQQYLNNVAAKIRQLHLHLKIQIPVYIIFTKCDLVSGFSEFFGDLSQEELTQVWGMTFNLKNCANPSDIQTQFQHEYHHLMLRLQQRVLSSLDSEKGANARTLIAAFPQQMQLFKKTILTFIAQLHTATQHEKSLLIRGTYFTSAKQGDPAHDFLLSSVGKPFNLQYNTATMRQERQESYFLSQLFFDVILPEGQFLGDSFKTQKIKKFSYRSALLFTPLALVFGIVTMSQAYHTSGQSFKSLNQDLISYRQITNNLQPDDPDITHTLPALNALDQASQQALSGSLVKSLFWPNHALAHAAHRALQRSLHNLFLPRVASHIESSLKNESYNNPRDLYVLLKGYLAFSPHGYTEPSTIIAPMESYWNNAYHDQPKKRQMMKQYLTLAASQQMDMLPLNRPLINKVRLKLQTVIPSERAYALLSIKAATSDIPDLDFHSMIGSPYANIFNDKRKKDYIPRLYSSSGFEKIYQPNHKNIAYQVAQDNREIGLTPRYTQGSHDIRQQVALKYNANYLSSWQSALSQIDIQQPTNAHDLIALLTNLASDHSSYKRLLDIIDTNTSAIGGDNINIKNNFAALNGYTDNINSNATYDQTKTIFIHLQQYFIQLEQATDKDKAYFMAAKNVIGNNTDNPLIQLSELAQRAPQPTKRWLIKIEHGAWKIICQHAITYINRIWQSTVYSEYTQTIQHRYPVYRLAHSQIPLDDFSHFFAPHGTLDTFLNKYIKMFINTDATDWHVYQVQGNAFHLQSNEVALFSHAVDIQKHFFTAKGQPRISLTIQPLTLSKTASSANLTLGDHAIVYQHGPRTPVDIHWPLTNESQKSSLVISDFRGNRYSAHAYGPWSLFKIFNQSHFNLYLNQGHYVLRASMGGYNALFNIDTTAQIGTLKLRSLNQLKFPDQLKLEP